MKHIKIPVWEFPDVKEHIATRYKITRDAEMDDVIVEATITDAREDGNTKTDYFFNHIVPEGSVYHCTATRIFDIADEDGDEEMLGPIGLYPNDGAEVSTDMIEYGVEIPTVNVETSIYDDNADTFTITCSQIRASGMQHLATNYVIEDREGRALFTVLNDREHLTSITVDKDDVNLDGLDYVVVKVSHIDANGKHSKWGKRVIDDLKGFLTIVNTVSSLNPTVDNVITLQVGRDQYVPDKVDIYTNNNKVEVATFTPDEVLGVANQYSFIIPEDTLSYDTEYIIRVYATGRLTDVHYSKLRLRTVHHSRNYNIVNTYKYTDGLTFINDTKNDEDTRFVPKRGYIEGLPNGYFLAPDGLGKLSFYEIGNKSLMKVGEVGFDLENPIDLTKPYNILYLNDAWLVMAYYTTEDKLIMLTMLTELHYGNVFNWKESVIDEDLDPEVGDIFMTVTSSTDVVYYITRDAYDILHFFSIDFKTHDITALALPDNGNFVDNGICQLSTGEVILVSRDRQGDDIDSLYHVFDVKQGLWRIGDVLPNDIQDLTYKPVMLKNGKVAIFQEKNNDPSNNEAYTFYLYDSESDRMNETGVLGPDYLGNTSILRQPDGRIFLTNEDSGVTQVYK
jgi:hypothetical protein